MRGDRHLQWDVRLLRVFYVVVSESSVSRAAERLGQSQPAVSATLRLLREMTGDPLLVRSGNRLVATENALRLRGEVETILGGIERLWLSEAPFDPATSRRHMRVVATTCFGGLILPDLIHRVRRDASGITLDLCGAPSDGSVDLLLERGDVDVVLGNWPLPALDFRISQLLESDTVCMVADGHPVASAARLTLDAYLGFDHLSPTLTDSAARSPIDGRLLQLGRKRRVAATVPEFALIPHVLLGSDLVFTTARSFAVELAAVFPLTVLEAPDELARMTLFMLWHEKTHRSPSHRWLREMIRTIAEKAVTRSPELLSSK